MADPRGHGWIVGAGPGDPGLLTLAAQRALANADLVLYDALVNPAILAMASSGAEFRYVGKRGGDHALTQAEIEHLLVDGVHAGKQVVRLKGGDPFVFGRGGEEALALRGAGLPFTVVPGVSSALAAPAYAGIPVTHRGVAGSVVVVTGSDSGEGGGIDWDAAAKIDTVIILMGRGALAEAARQILGAGRAPATPAACIQWGTRNDQRVVRATLATIASEADRAGIQAPIVTVVGEVAALAGELAWFAPGPLAGRRVVVTRARSQASGLRERLEGLGAHVVEAPVISVRPRWDNLTTDERVASRWDWIAFTSANGVESFFAALASAGRDARALATTKVAAVGEATASTLRSAGVVADFQPSVATAAALAAELPRVAGARILLPVSSLTDSSVADALRARGGHVEQVAVYETVPEPLDAALRREVKAADAITFTSASTARNLAAALCGEALPETVKLVSIGPRTTAAVRQAFGRVDAEAAEPGLAALTRAVQEVLGGHAD